jgi:hypothetical protein
MNRLLVFGCLLGLTNGAWAQGLTVQQPVVSTFSVGTSVSVPDRGSAFLGGVGSARSSRTTTGPLRNGSSIGLERQASSVSTSVYIHDLRAMDEALLATGSADDPTDLGPAARALSARHGVGRLSGQARLPAQTIIDHTAEAARFERLAQAAEAKGKPGVALLHWRMAAKYGSTLGQTRMNETASTR